MGLLKPLKKIKRNIFSDRRIAYLELSGIIAEQREMSSTPELLELLDKIEEEEFPALLLHINSPGGTVGASQAVYDRLMELRKENGLKVVITFGDVSASGGVYVAMAADKIISHGGTITGSIGVIIKSSNFREVLDKIGIQSEVIKSGEFKDILSSDRALTEAEKALLQSTIDDTYEQFVSVVASGRNLDINTVKSFADGRVFTGQQALKHKLVDALGGKSLALKELKKLMGLAEDVKPKVVVLQKKKSILDRLISGENVLKSQQLTAPIQQWVLQETTLNHRPLWLMASKLALF